MNDLEVIIKYDYNGEPSGLDFYEEGETSAINHKNFLELMKEEQKKKSTTVL